MGLDSLVTSMNSGVTKVTGVTAKQDKVIPVTNGLRNGVTTGYNATAQAGFVTRVTRPDGEGLQPKPLQDGAVTLVTPVTPKKEHARRESELPERIHAMAERWQYSADEIAEALRLAVAAPADWLRLIEHDKTLAGGIRVPEELPAVPRVTGRCADCRSYRRTTHPHLGHCARGAPEPAGGLWATTWRYCEQFQSDQSAVPHD